MTTETTDQRTLLTDVLGSTITELDSNTNLLAEYTYGPFGQTSATGAPRSLFQYTGRENDGTGLYYYRARYYNPVLHRFISEDPVGFDGGDANLYRYVRGNPLRWIDPRGLYWEYSQSTGQLWHFPPEGGAAEFIGEGYAGSGEGLNNPLYQLEPEVGPLPEGAYTIGPLQENTTLRGTVLPESMRLYPGSETDMFGRAGFLIHGGSFRTFNSSNGCIVLPPEVRRIIGRSGDNELRVVR